MVVMTNFSELGRGESGIGEGPGEEDSADV